MSDTEVFLTEHLRNKLLCASSKESGVILGWWTGVKYIGIDCGTNSDYFIQGLYTVGFVMFFDDRPATPDKFLASCKKKLSHLEKLDDDPFCLFVYPTVKDGVCTSVIEAKLLMDRRTTVVDLKISEKNADLSNILLFRASCRLPLMFEVSPDKEVQIRNMTKAVEKAKTIFSSGGHVLYSDVTNQVVKSGTEQDCITCKEYVREHSDPLTNEKRSKKGKRAGLEEKVPVNFKILLQTATIHDKLDHSLVIHCQRRQFQLATMHLPLDAVVVVFDANSLSNVYDLVTKSMLFQLEQMSECMQDYHVGSEFPLPEVYHFLPYGWDFPIDLIYPAGVPDSELDDLRITCMNELYLPLDKPLFRKTNYCLSTEESNSGYLLNPHVGLSPSGVEGGTVATVHGRYAYHHYMQDSVNDDGWGCAYRSLQTIVSWFRLQGYTSRKVPTHEEIQQALVAIGDKPASFVGSRKWIGSQEVSFCLDHLLGVTSKIMFVNSGEDLGNRGRELLHHFQSSGAPVMIGGGVLAHTILGVDFNQNTGDVKYLVLDPHYTGSEDIGIIQSKGWCGWKPIKFWDKTAFYNLCLPQRTVML